MCVGACSSSILWDLKQIKFDCTSTSLQQETLRGHLGQYISLMTSMINTSVCEEEVLGLHSETKKFL